MLTLDICRYRPTPYSIPLFPPCSSSALGNIKFEGGACAGCQEILCSPKGYYNSDYGNKVVCWKYPVGPLVILITAVCHLH